MRIADIYTRSVVRVGTDASLRDAAELMRTRHVGSLVVVDETNGGMAPAGILTDRDIVVAVVAPGADVEALKVADVMNRRVATCMDDDDLFTAIRIMRENGVRRLPVVDANGALAGIVAADDIYSALGTHMSELSHALLREQVREMRLRP